MVGKKQGNDKSRIIYLTACGCEYCGPQVVAEGCGAFGRSHVVSDGD